MLNPFSINNLSTTTIYNTFVDVSQLTLFGSVVRTVFHWLKESNNSGVGKDLRFSDTLSNSLLDLIPYCMWLHQWRGRSAFMVWGRSILCNNRPILKSSRAFL